VSSIPPEDFRSRHRQFADLLFKLILENLRPQHDFPKLRKRLLASARSSRTVGSFLVAHHRTADKFTFDYAMKHNLNHIVLASTVDDKAWTLSMLKQTLGNSNWLKKRLKIDLRRSASKSPPPRSINSNTQARGSYSATGGANDTQGQSKPVIYSEYVQASSLEFDLDMIIRSLDKLAYPKDLLEELQDLKHCMRTHIPISSHSLLTRIALSCVSLLCEGQIWCLSV